MTQTIPFGRLVSFGNFTFTGPSHPVSDITQLWQQSYAPQANKKYPVDLYGLSDAPRKDPLATWSYLFLATAGLYGTAAYANVQAQFNAFLAALQTPYTVTGTILGVSVTGVTVSGQVGNLVVKDADGTTNRTAWARIQSVDAKLLPAKNTYAYECPLQFLILEDFH